MIAQIPRSDDGLFTLDFAFSTGALYIGSLGVLIDGSGVTSWIWFRWRAAQKELLSWVTDRDPHSTSLSVNGRTYSITVQGRSSFLGYDDILVTLSNG